MDDMGAAVGRDVAPPPSTPSLISALVRSASSGHLTSLVRDTSRRRHSWSAFSAAAQSCRASPRCLLCRGHSADAAGGVLLTGPSGPPAPSFLEPEHTRIAPPLSDASRRNRPRSDSDFPVPTLRRMLSAMAFKPTVADIEVVPAPASTRRPVPPSAAAPAGGASIFFIDYTSYYRSTRVSGLYARRAVGQLPVRPKVMVPPSLPQGPWSSPLLAGLSAGLGSPLSLTPSATRRPSLDYGVGAKRAFGDALAEGSAPKPRPSSLRLLVAAAPAASSPVLAPSVSWPWFEGASFTPHPPPFSSLTAGPEEEADVGMAMQGEESPNEAAQEQGGGKRLRGRYGDEED
jgi:hypothetical protein